MNTYRFKLFTLLCVLLVTMLSVTGCQKKKQKPGLDMSGRSVMRILFVGDENTFLNNMPYMLQVMAQTDPNAHFRVEIGMHVEQNSSLAKLWSKPNKKIILTQQKWDYVVLQPNLMWASSEGSVYLTQKAIAAWTSDINNIGAQPVLFMTWPHDKNNTIYGDMKFLHLKNYKNMHRLIKGYSKVIANKYGLFTVPVGNYWLYAMANKPNISLFNPDGETPNIFGSYLTALVFYKLLVDDTLDDTGYLPEGMTNEAKTSVIELANTPM